MKKITQCRGIVECKIGMEALIHWKLPNILTTLCPKPPQLVWSTHIQPFAFACTAQTVISTFSGSGNNRNVTTWYSCILRLKGAWCTVGES